MSIITISKSSSLYGKNVAQSLAEKLGYECISREDILDTSGQFKIPEIMLGRDYEIPPSLFERLFLNKERYKNYIGSAFLNRMKKGNIIYHGFAGHMFIKNIPNICKVLITVTDEYRINYLMEKEKLSLKEAQKSIEKEDAVLNKWRIKLYGVDINAPDQYDMVFRVDNLTEEDITDIILDALKKPCFQITPEISQALEDLSVEAEIKVRLFEKFPIRYISSKNGVATILIESTRKFKEKATPEVQTILNGISGLKNYELHFKH